MFNSDGRLEGYDYPPPSTAGVTVRWEPVHQASVLSRENAEKIREAVRQQSVQKQEPAKVR
jgi:hypothetical protein